MTQKHLGWGLVAVAFFMLLNNLGDAVSLWQNWQLPTPQFVGMILKQVSATGLAAVGGKMLPEIRMGGTQTRSTDPQPED